MSIITFLLTTLALLSPTLSSSLEPRRWGHEIDMGVLTSEWTPGFVGDRPYTGPDGDYLRTTFCYCKTAFEENKTELTRRMEWTDGAHRDGQTTAGGNGIQPDEILQGHFWRYEYFNFHNNATYWLNHYCMEDAFPKDLYGCGYDAPGQFEPSPDAGLQTYHAILQNDIMFNYSPIPGHDKHTWTIYKKQSDVDWIMYGRGETMSLQKRRLAQNQGLITMPRSYVEDKCDHYCDTELLLPRDPNVWSHGELYNDIDDMCDRCA